MKGRISPALARILSDPAAREQIHDVIDAGGGKVVAHGVTYTVRVGVPCMWEPPVRESFLARFWRRWKIGAGLVRP